MQLYYGSIRARIIWPVVGILLICFLVLGSMLAQIKGGLQKDLVLNEYVSYYGGLLDIVHTDELRLLETVLKGASNSVELADLVSAKNSATLTNLVQAIGEDLWTTYGLSNVIVSTDRKSVV